MRKIINAIVIVPLALVLLAFAVANRRFVVVSFNPFDSADLSMALNLPLFIVIIASAILGVIAGSCVTWFGQRHWRRAARRHEAEVADARLQLADLRLKLAPPVALTRPSGPSVRPSYPAIGQDKQGATL
ncbi:MAG: lipopolysaccharide assembly protein LapA domain-containing protein [Xanthobacteraceae bacterium]|nr:lipopolysaccharide assembly protein LapA domain-containing protein [Xanthobacteraceae bacterium]